MCAGLPLFYANGYGGDCLLRVPERCNWTLAFNFGRMLIEDNSIMEMCSLQSKWEAPATRKQVHVCLVVQARPSLEVQTRE
eukprot:2783572-Karenia_brevis.AAC.1